MQESEFLTVDGALKFLTGEIGVQITRKQLYRAIEPRPDGSRRLPFFEDPITGRLIIDTAVLRRLYPKKPDTRRTA